MTAVPRPPFLPDNLEQFVESLPNRTQDWYAYASAAYQYIEHTQTRLSDVEEKASQSALRAEALTHEVEHLTRHHQEELQLLQAELHTVRAESAAVIKYQKETQKEQIQDWQEKFTKAIEEKNQALRLAAPTVRTPLSSLSPDTPAEKTTANVPLAPPPAAASPSQTSRLSERIPDPEKFEGDRKDLRRFVSQIYEKMTANRDRFPTPISRMTYVTNRLRGPPYAQILPYIKKGVCQLSDYEEILESLDHSFGDPNRVDNARDELYRLRQTNKDFGTFFAEFQRLALEGEMPEDALPIMLGQAINKELRVMLMHSEPPSREYHRFASFLQELENRRRQYENATPLTTSSRTYASAARPAARSASPRPAVVAYVPPNKAIAIGPTRDPDVMDTSVNRRPRAYPLRPTRRERGECFRCGATDHLVAVCPEPDLRPAKKTGVSRGRSGSSRSKSKCSHSCSSHSQSEKGASLG
jgi:hypothetical protein